MSIIEILVLGYIGFSILFGIVNILLSFMLFTTTKLDNLLGELSPNALDDVIRARVILYKKGVVSRTLMFCLVLILVFIVTIVAWPYYFLFK